MFDIGKKYWFTLRAKDVPVNLKGKVVEENDFFVKIEMDSGKVEIIPFARVLNINEDRGDKDG